MSRHTVIGITRDVINASGEFIAPGPGLALLDEMDGVQYELFSGPLKEVLAQEIQGYDMVFSLTPSWTADSVKGAAQLLCVHRFGVGYDMIDVPALTEAGVLLCITPDAVRRPVAGAILTFIMALSTRLLVKDRLVREGRSSERARFHGIGLVGKTLGVIGVGNIGHEVFRLTAPLGMRHLGCDPYITQESVDDVGVKLVDMETILAESDFLSVSCPLNDETHHLIGEEELKKMKPTSFLINTARGPVVDETALIRALSEGWIQGAGLDVFDPEPPEKDNPLLMMDNVVLAPHALGWLDQTFAGMWDIILGQMNALRRGEVPAGVVNPGVWESPLFRGKLKAFLEAAT